jgi:outer membrane protein TolC
MEADGSHLKEVLQWLSCSLLAMCAMGCAARNPRFADHHAAERRVAVQDIVKTSYHDVEQIAVEYSANPAAYHCAKPRQITEEPTNFWNVSLVDLLADAMKDGTILRDLGGQILVAPQQAASRLDPSIQLNDPQFGPQAALSAFDRSFSHQLFFDRNDRAFNNQIVGGNAVELQQDLVTAQSRVAKRTLTGTEYALQGTTIYDDNNRIGNLFQNSWESQAEASVRKPLLRGAGSAFNSIAGPNALPGFNFSNGIVVARLNTSISEIDLEIALRNHLRQAEETYWQLYGAYQELEARRGARDAAVKTWQSIKARADQKLGGGEADKEAQARFQSLHYQELYLEALNGSPRTAGVYETERRLRKLLGMVATDDRVIRPIDQPHQAPLVYEWSQLLPLALKERPELRRQALRVRQQELKLVAARNFLLPRLDAIGAYRVRGLGDDLFGNGARFSSAFQDLSSFDHQEWRLGVEMDMPAGMRQARAAVNHALLQVTREREVLKEQELFVSHELSDVVARVAHLQSAKELAFRKMEAAEARYQATDAQFTAGHSALHLLLESQEQRFESQRQYHSICVTHALTVTQVSYALGTYLREMQVSQIPPACLGESMILQ